MISPGYNGAGVGWNVKVDADGFKRHLQVYAEVMGGSTARILRRQARLFCQDMIDYTLPVENGPGTGSGGTMGAKKITENNVRQDIELVFAPLGYASMKSVADLGNAGVFSAWLRERKAMPTVVLPDFLKDMDVFDGSNQFPAFQKFASKLKNDNGHDNLTMVYSGSVKTLHEAARGGPRNYATSPNVGPGKTYFIADYNMKVPAYINQVQKRVGKLKAGWYTAGMRLNMGNVRAPKWVVNNQWGTGIMDDRLDNPLTPSVTVGNSAHKRHTEMTRDGVSWLWYKLAIFHRAYSMRVEILNKLIKQGNARKIWELSKPGGPLEGGYFFNT
jgi:hypothetical protein